MKINIKKKKGKKRKKKKNNMFVYACDIQILQLY